MDVNGPGSIQSAFPIKPSQPASEVRHAAPARPVAPRDEVEISEAGRMLDNLNRSGEVRAERLAQIKAAIDADTYETPEKLEKALERMLHEIGRQDDLR